MDVAILIASRYQLSLMSKYYHAPKQAWQTGVLIQCRYGLSGVILFIFLIILNIWIYYTINFCRFTFCFYILMAKQTNGENGPSLMRHIYKRFFSKIEELRNYVKKKNGHRNYAMNSYKNKNRPILRDKIVLMILFIRSHFVIDRSCTTIKLHISSVFELKAQKVTG
jgi:hypothetical protein